MAARNLLLALAAACIGCSAMHDADAAPVALNDEEMSKVSGQDGVSLGVHLELNSALLAGAPTDSRITAGFNVDGTKTYAVIQNLAGVMDLIAVTLSIRQRPDGGGDYVDIGLPGFVGFKQFGFRALAAQTDPAAPIPASASYGQILLNGTGSMTGHIYLWAQ
ncbi:hypothetical protein [Piscinibacter terrae]|uniref:DUF4402 domain-containing protein n=1 Tax=Piscinibacter terrae TaxID=2496871 RepID=A0A3N7HS87_9BURK|nr:hypothetical protein [Albitalea terrae]RQP25137.1 hypothetical protein DZC73_09810 [Albitalea terrae]